MINNYIRGGQIFLHKIRMFLQVWYKTFSTSLLIGIIYSLYMNWGSFYKLDHLANLTYLKALAVKKIETSTPYNISNSISVKNKFGIWEKNINPSRIIDNAYYKKEFYRSLDLLLETLKLLLEAIAASMVLIIVFWYQFGKKINKKHIINNSYILSGIEVYRQLKKMRKLSIFTVGKMPLVKDSETSHFFISGTTGSGKTTLMHHLLPQIRSQNQSAIIIDFNGAMSAEYYKEGDIIIGRDSFAWDLLEDIRDEDTLEIILNTLYPTKSSNYDIMWNNASRQFFRDGVDIIIKKGQYPNIEKLYNFLAKEPLSEIHQKLVNTTSYNMLDPANERTAMSVRTNTISSLAWMENLNRAPNKVSISHWIKNLDENRGSWIFLKASPKERAKLYQLFSILIEVAINEIMELGEDRERRIWMIIDELASLQYIPSLTTALSEFRKYGGCIMASTQSANQLSSIYGNNIALSMIDQFNTKFIFRSKESGFNQYLIKSIGNVEYIEQNENYSYGSHEIRDGVNISKAEKHRPIINSSDIGGLDDLECYVTLPINKIKLAKIKIPALYHKIS